MPTCAAWAVLLALACAPTPAFAEHRAGAGKLTSKPAASNPYRHASKRDLAAKVVVIARWTEPPTFAIAPRTAGISLGTNYFQRSAYAGPSQRGLAYNVRRNNS